MGLSPSRGLVTAADRLISRTQEIRGREAAEGDAIHRPRDGRPVVTEAVHVQEVVRRDRGRHIATVAAAVELPVAADDCYGEIRSHSDRVARHQERLPRSDDVGELGDEENRPGRRAADAEVVDALEEVGGAVEAQARQTVILAGLVGRQRSAARRLGVVLAHG